MVPALKRYMKELVARKVVEEENVMMVTKECSAILQNKVLTKKGDPGRFVISVKIGPMTYACSLCDLGSSVNLMPYSVAKRLGFTKFKPTKISLVFADRSTKLPIGVIEHLHVRIGDTLIPADFMVLELDEEPKDPLILGCAFLCTSRAIIDVEEGIVDLRLGDMVVRFEMNKLLKKPMIDGQTFIIHDGSEIAGEVTEEILAKDSLEVALTKAEGVHGFLSEDTEGFAKILDSSIREEKMVAYMILEGEKNLMGKDKAGAPAPTPGEPAPDDSISGSWSELKAPKLELKALPAGLRYAFLSPNST
ncbi:hypothetical protein V5N11_034284 [Cardamine amara subsp. amara]|uniref:Aspartic peptidase DDI1-type domain-containing protein n=1 Tax=Cardamine amara subsp. amara TaxID=228776 RepID=A0ABD1C238_CARAN